jgi:hypothetical protein
MLRFEAKHMTERPSPANALQPSLGKDLHRSAIPGRFL